MPFQKPLDAVPETAEREVHPDREDSPQARFEVRRALGNHRRIIDQDPDHGRREPQQHDQDRSGDRDSEQQAAVERDGGLALTTLAVATCHHGLDARGEPHHEGHRHEVGKARKPDRRQGCRTESADHRRIDQIQHVLRGHPAHDWQREIQDGAQSVPADRRGVALCGHGVGLERPVGIRSSTAVRRDCMISSPAGCVPRGLKPHPPSLHLKSRVPLRGPEGSGRMAGLIPICILLPEEDV